MISSPSDGVVLYFFVSVKYLFSEIMSAGESMENSYNFLIVAFPPPKYSCLGEPLKDGTVMKIILNDISERH